jgi:4,5-dihydroxyphthalate decarboxylase
MMAKELDLTFSLADYDRTQPLLSGAVKADGIHFQFRPAVPGEACLIPVYEQFDIAEMSLSWYAMARLRGEPVIALPIFPMRMFIQPYIFCSAASPARAPEDLRGKKVGMDQYRLTVGLWARGILQEFYGVRPGEMSARRRGRAGGLRRRAVPARPNAAKPPCAGEIPPVRS